MDTQKPSKFMQVLLTDRGHMKRWRAKIMADWTMPYVYKMKMCLLSEMEIIAMLIVKEFLINLGLKSTYKIFEAEAGFNGKMDREFHYIVRDLNRLSENCLRLPLVAEMLDKYKASFKSELSDCGAIATFDRLTKVQSKAKDDDKEWCHEVPNFQMGWSFKLMLFILCLFWENCEKIYVLPSFYWK